MFIKMHVMKFYMYEMLQYWTCLMFLQEDNEGFDATALVNNCSVEEAKYLLEHFIQTSIGRVRSK